MNAVLKKMSRADKLRVMEELWSDLTSNEGKFPSPSWHFDELHRTEEDIRSGRTKFMEWEQAKKAIRRRAK